ncbi:MAG: hypothetical protein WBD31_10630, partial [Rubripirellula sp.]
DTSDSFAGGNDGGIDGGKAPLLPLSGPTSVALGSDWGAIAPAGSETGARIQTVAPQISTPVAATIASHVVDRLSTERRLASAGFDRLASFRFDPSIPFVDRRFRLLAMDRFLSEVER